MQGMAAKCPGRVKNRTDTPVFDLFWGMLKNIPLLTTSYGPHCVNSEELMHQKM